MPGPVGAISWNTLTGNECYRLALSPGGPEAWISLNQTRNTVEEVTTATTTGAVTLNQTNMAVIFTAALTGGITLNLPPTPPDGQTVVAINGTVAAFTQTITATATDGATVVNATAVNLGAGASANWVYNATANTWYKVR